MNTLRILAFAIIVSTSLFVPFGVYVALVLVYALLWRGIEILILGACIDVYFGTSGSLTELSYFLTAVLVLFGSIIVKPYIRFYQ
jgi:hypothetical protein